MDEVTTIPEGAVTRQVVIMVLRTISGTGQFSFSYDGDATITVVKDAVPNVYILPEYVPRKMLHTLSRIAGLGIEYFYRPDKFVPGPTGIQ
jgi:hypothetical protein